MQEKIEQVQKKFEEDSQQIASVIESTLLKIISHNKDTEYGKKYGFAKITNLKEFKQIHPLTKYEHYESFIQRMFDGEENVLSKDSPIFFARSSGTTSISKQKLIPATKDISAFPWSLLIEGAVHQAFPLTKDLTKEFNQSLLIVNANGLEYKTKNGIRVGFASSAQLPQLMKKEPFPFTSPKEVFSITHNPTAAYLHAFYGLKNPNILYINSTFATAVLNFFRCIEENWQKIVKDIRLGTISNNYLIIAPEIKQKLLDDLEPNPQRADELVHLFEEGLENIASRVWPNLQYIRCLAGGTFSIYVEKCQPYIGNVPVYSAAYGASEGLLGINLWPGKHIARFIPVPQERYTEYIPVAETTSPNPTTLEVHQLKKGESYEVVMTHYKGFYRYRMGDIIKVVDRYNELPIYELEGRAGTLLDIAGEKTTEEMSHWSINQAVESQSYHLIDYTTMIDINCSPPRYLFFVELADYYQLSATEVSQLEQTLSKELEKKLKIVNSGYHINSTLNKIHKAQVLLVQKGTFRTAIEILSAQGVPEVQIKIPRYARKPELIKLLQENRIIATN
ncbi:MAG: GH3 auxin-responsive promoter family protein [Moorea sp. SIOASIH]|uniref:GH3 auxin-responsive promoter family protein n=1 Tax=Moorena sp. SIOASIH TaxID=2607817 RepID=UPI0013BD171F|nr:GH3 auxin-responsive promoter family protein [Moorena sp. SIOASIH]NEO39176.1 GH3 auxin-responsive promoter family protein [Moorena sp. SIOASIH]